MIEGWGVGEGFPLYYSGKLNFLTTAFHGKGQLKSSIYGKYQTGQIAFIWKQMILKQASNQRQRKQEVRA